MEVVDRIEILVFFVPAEDGAPETDVNVRFGDSWDDLAREAFIEKRI